MSKHSFTTAERYAVWLHHEKRCWLCEEPLRLLETTIDHYLPESLLNHPDKLSLIQTKWELPRDFKINGFENWLPCHQRCNQAKGATDFEFTPGHDMVVRRLLARAPDVQKTAISIGANTRKDKVIAYVLAALEKETVTLEDLQVFSQDTPTEREMIRLDTGYWLHRRDVARECDCHCERNHCVNSTRKLHLYFSSGLSQWVIQAGLHWRCYDEIVTCRRCEQRHKRGHIGAADVCGRPYRDQMRQNDEL
jgi:hypothetical protein